MTQETDEKSPNGVEGVDAGELSDEELVPAEEAHGAAAELAVQVLDEEQDETKKKKAKGKIKFESTMQREEAVTYFRALVDGLDAGHLVFKQGEESLELDPTGPVTVEVKASLKGDRQKVSFELEWRTLATESFNIES